MKALRRTLLVLVLIVPLTAAAGGCQFFAWFMAQFSPPKSVDALYKLPEGKKVLVFVDDFRRPVRWEPIKQLLTERINAELAEHKVAAATVSYEKLEDLVHAARDFNRMPIPNVGRELGADLVVYVEIRRFSLKENEQSPLWQGHMDVNVKAVNSRTGLLWPEDRPDGYPLSYADPRPSENLSETYGRVVAKNVAAKMGRNIARLFYDHTVPTRVFGDEDEK
jgi:hypothetical protein